MNDTSSATSISAANDTAAKAEIRLKREFIDNLREQKVDVNKNKTEIDKLWEKIKDNAASKEMQELVSDSLKSQRIIKAFLANTILTDGFNNVLELEQSCQESGINSVDNFIASFDGRLKESLQRFCFGVANSNDMEIIITEANTLNGKLNKPEQALKDFVEEVIKPHASSYLTRASKIDKIYQANLLNFGTTLHWENEIVRNSTDTAFAALFANEFGMSSVGLQDVRNLFDFHLERHGGKYLYDAKLKDGQMADKYPKKSINVLADEHMEAFVDMAGKSAAHGRSTQPEIGDMFLRVCGYEYFMPQAVRTAGTNNIFAENPEAPAAYPMINSVINDFIEKMSLNPIEKYREQVGEKLDILIADTFIDFFSKLGKIHDADQAITEHRERLAAPSLSEKYAPTFASYIKRITKDAKGRFDLFLDIYKENLEKTLKLAPEKTRENLEIQIQNLSEPTRTMLFPEVVKPGSHQAKLIAHYEEHTYTNMSGEGKS